MAASAYRCLVLAYHEIAPLQPTSRRSLVISPRTFAFHLSSLKLAGGRCISLDQLADGLQGKQPLPKRSFVITFDDGYIGVYHHAVPLLKRFGFSATVFVPSALIGQRAQSSDIPPVEKMTADQLKEIARNGIAIGAHTRTHADLPTLDEPSRCDEVRNCRSELEALLTQPVTTFAYPFGRFDQPTVAAVRAAGYLLACTTQYGVVQGKQDPFLVPRVLVGDNLQFPLFLYRCWRAARAPVESAAS